MSSQPYTYGQVDLYLVLESTGCHQVKPFVQIVREAGKNLHKHIPPQERGKNKIYTVYSTAELENVFYASQSYPLGKALLYSQFL